MTESISLFEERTNPKLDKPRMVEKVTDSDFATLAEIAKRAIRQSVDAMPSIKDDIIGETEVHLTQGLSGGNHVFLNYGDKSDVILGFILIKDAWNLSDLFVEPRAHHRGIGRQLFQEALSVVISRENRGYIRVNSSLNAEGFYRKLGFQSFTPEKPSPEFVVPLIYRFAPEPSAA
ncbi:MAG: GNAT family N-acetyltransferase [Verrucomicrobiae bacterium]|nr:GNAT family N-acetyltransferase [Verrucomicrobiae bacterium]